MFYSGVKMFSTDKRKKNSEPFFSLKPILIHFGTKHACQSMMIKEENPEQSMFQHKRGAVFLLFVLLLLLWITPIHPQAYGPLFSPFSESIDNIGSPFNTTGSIPERGLTHMMFPAGLPL